MSAPVESKVTAASVGALVGGFLVGWIVLEVPALAGLADPLQAAIAAAVTSGVTFALGWLAKHTPRPPEPPLT
ncbi:hypothetical protein ACQEU3_46685 [Spirillospora sp. CA-253888]